MLSIGHTPGALDQWVAVDATVARPAADWRAARDAVLRGLVHALSNRAGTVGAVASMLDGAQGESVVTAARVLDAEATRLDALVAHFRLVTAEPAVGGPEREEPVHVPELLAEVALVAGYVEGGGAVAVDAPPEVRPAVAVRAALAHALLAMVVAAGRGGEAVTVRARNEGGEVTVWVDGATSAGLRLRALGGSTSTEAGT